MLIPLDEYPFHQITASFSGVGGSDPQWNDGHYICFGDQAGTVAVLSTLRLYSNNDVLDGFVCIRHQGKQYNLRVSRRLRPDMELTVGPMRLELLEPMRTIRLVLEDNEQGISLDVTCRSTTAAYEGPPEVTRIDGRLVSERMTYEITGRCTGHVTVAGQRCELEESSASFFRNHSWGYQAGRGGPRLYTAPTVGAAPRRVPGVRQWVLFDMPDHGGFYFIDPSGRRASGKGAILLPDRSIPVVAVEHELDFYEGGRRLRGGSFRLTDADGAEHRYQVHDLGWVYSQGGGYFGGFDDGLGQGVYRGDHYVEGEVWDVSHPTRIVDEAGQEFEFDHAWAENFVRLEGDDGATGMAHFECVVIQQPQDWSASPGRTEA